MTTNEAEEVIKMFMTYVAANPHRYPHNLAEALTILLKDRKELQDALIPWAGLAHENVSSSVWEDVLKARAALSNRSIT